jgi:hypothetical protein
MNPHSFEKPDPGPHSPKKLVPDPHKVNADPKHWLLEYVNIEETDKKCHMIYAIFESIISTTTKPYGKRL